MAADTPRSKAYAQAMLERGMRIGHTIIFDKAGARQPGKAAALQTPAIECGVTLPDLSVPLAETCGSICRSVETIEAETVNDEQIVSLLRTAADNGARLVVYSGYGGQLVGREVLDVGMPLLHAHSGWLPEYPGSTTIYYSLLNGDGCGVSAILLAAEIDKGPIVLRRQYPPPPAEVDIDYFYDAAIRADLMVETLSEWRSSNGFTAKISQESAGAENYYVIHPLLKHLSTMKIRAAAQARHQNK